MKTLVLLPLLIVLGLPSFSQQSSLPQENKQTQVSLKDLSAFKPNAGNWFVVSAVAMDPRIDIHAAPVSAAPTVRKRKKNKGAIAGEHAQPQAVTFHEGSGVLLNVNSEGKKDNLFANWEHGDIDLELEVMMPKGSNSGIYVQGGYEVQLLDSWGVKNPGFGDIGGIYLNHEKDPSRRYAGKAPLVNAARAPGLWQTLRISFRAPRFDDNGKKVANARFVYIDLNGVRIHDNVEVPFLTAGSGKTAESPRGALMIQGDHGPVAIRNIRYSEPMDVEAPRISEFASQPWPVSPILVKVGNEPTLLRAFLDFDGDESKRLTHTIAVGEPSGAHYIYDLKAGNIACVWRGEFIDATPMWHNRGDGSYRPRGMTQYLFLSPALAELSGTSAPFPDTSASTEFRSHGYTMQNDRPVFNYTYKGIDITDRIVPEDEGRILTREVTFGDSTASSLYFKLAEGKVIAENGDRYFAIDDRKYYIKLLSPQKEIIRERKDGVSELYVNTKGNPVKYSIIW